MTAPFPLLPVERQGAEARVSTPSKLNLFLEVERRREDGYHDISTLMVPIDFGDELRVRESSAGEDQLTVEGLALDGARNLILVALDRMRESVEIPPLEMVLTKHVPPGTGLGGGSANAAGIIAVVRDLLGEAVDPETWGRAASAVGSDVPFFLGSGAALATGRGEHLTPFRGELFGGDRPSFLVLLPEVFSSTAVAYSHVSFPLTSPEGPITVPKEVFVGSGEWPSGLFNRLQAPITAQYDALASLATWLEANVPGHWGMTGSGSAFFVVCRDSREAERIDSRVKQERPQVAGVALGTQIVRAMFPDS